MSRNYEASVRCEMQTARGRQCRNWAMHGSDPPRCASHVSLAGRHTILTDELATTLVTMLRAGNYVHVAVRAAGVSRRTFAYWMQRGRSQAPADAAFRELRERVEEARAEGEVRAVAQIAKAATDTWQAAAWLLERQYPERWGRVSVRVRDEPPSTEAPAAAELDPFMEVDELAEARRRRGGGA